MNFLVSIDHSLISRYQAPLLENGETMLLANFMELLWRAAAATTGFALIDKNLPGFPGMSGIAQLKRSNQNIKILLLDGKLAAEEELAALAAGAAGSCGSNLPPEKIRQILTTVGSGGVWISGVALPHLLERLKRWEDTNKVSHTNKNNGSDSKGMAELTPREREIVNLVAKGESNKLIARELNITDRTVKSHLSIIFQKLKVHDRLQLALFATRNSVQ
jgi:two-component system nitrate/nitrite response regulator NarL